MRTLDQDDITQDGGSKTALWNLTNDEGGMVAGGIYIYLILTDTEKTTGKIAIVR